MAIIFVSPKKKQRVFIWSITGLLLLSLFLISILVFPLQFTYQNPITEIVDTQDVPTIKIHSIIDSEELKKLTPFVNVPEQGALGRPDPFAAYYQGTK